MQTKIDRLQTSISPFNAPELEVFASPVSHYRMRAEFRIWHQDGKAHYAMYRQGHYKQPYVIDAYPVGSHAIERVMGPLLESINANTVLSRRLFQVEFLSTLTGECLVTLIYHRPLDDTWEQQASALAASLDIDLVGRSRKQKLIVGKDYVTEHLQVGGRIYRYRQIETGFTQPNARVCEKMLEWAVDCTAGSDGDLLELYCGNGNFTLPLATNFRRVLATEVSKTSVQSAQANLSDNVIDNVDIVRMSSEDISQALAGVRNFRRLRHLDLSDYQFTTVFVDPPRAGLDELTLDLVANFRHILYISCNPVTLTANLQQLQRSHTPRRAALFDQFPYTDHIEAGILLVKRGDT